MRVLMLVWTDVAHDARVLREMAALVDAGHTVHVVGRAVPPDWEPPAGVTASSARARSPFRSGDAPSTEQAPPAAGGRAPVAAARSLARWALLPEHVVLSLRSWTEEAYADAAGRTFDLVHAHDYTALPLGARLAREHGVPLVYDAHEWWAGRARHGRPEPLRRWRQAQDERRLAREAAAVLTVSEGIAERFRAWGVRDVAVVRNTFPTPLDGPVATALRGLLYAGRVAEGRDLETALRAAPRLAPVDLVLMGPSDPGFLARVPGSSAARTRPIVAVDQVDAVLRELGASLVSLEDSCDNHRLALPNKVFQAVRAGVPVVAADLPELRRLVTSTGIGTLYTPGDPESLVAAVHRLEADYPAHVDAARRAREQLRWEVDRERLLAVYAGLEHRAAPQTRAADAGSAAQPDAACAQVSIVSPVHDVADARLHRIADALVARGLSVEVLGTGDPHGAPRGTAAEVLPRVGPVRRGLRAAALPRRARGRVLLTIAPDVVPFAALDRLLRRRPWVCDVYEDYLPLLADRRWARGPLGVGARSVARLADRLAAGADLVTVADEHVPPRAARCRLVLPNVPAPARLTPAPREAAPRAVYVGDVRTSRGLRDMLAALELAPGWTLDVVGPVAAQDQAWLDEWCRTSPAADRVRLHGRLDPARSWEVAAGAWVGLVLLHGTPAFRRAFPSKVYEYAAAGLAVLASPLPRVAEALEGSGAGATAADPAQAAAVLRRWADHPEEHAAVAAAATEWWHQQARRAEAYDELADAVADLATRPVAARRGPRPPAAPRPDQQHRRTS